MGNNATRVKSGSRYAWLIERALSWESGQCIIWPYCCSGGYGRVSVNGKSLVAFSNYIPALARLSEFLAGRITHYVVIPAYESPRIVETVNGAIPVDEAELHRLSPGRGDG